MNLNDKPVAAIWCRVSTNDQRELSLDSQEATVRKALAAQGYQALPQYVLKIDWSSLDLMACPEFQKLRQWIARNEVQALGVLDRDRLQAQGLQRLIFLSECHDHNVRVITAQGVPLLDGAEGQLVELALALGKERSVMRAQQGARQGLRDRAVLKGLPPTMSKPYGMRWENNHLLPDEHYSTVCDIWSMALTGWKLRAIAKELTYRGIPTPRGKRVWTGNTVSCILRNRVYAGVVEALKMEVVTPKQRRGNTYGKSSRRYRRDTEPIRLEGLVEQPVITEGEFDWVRQRLRDNQRFAAKNTRLREYLLRGCIRCARCHRTYIGVTTKGRSYYYCGGRWSIPWGADRCTAESFPADKIEGDVYKMVVDFLRGPDGFLKEISRRQGLTEQSLESLKREIADLDRQDREVRETEARAFRLAALGKVSEEIYGQEIGLIQTRRRWIDEQRQRLEAQIADLECFTVTPESLAALRSRVEERLESASVEDRRFVLDTIGASVITQGDGTWELELKVPREIPTEVQIANTLPWNTSPGTHPGFHQSRAGYGRWRQRHGLIGRR